VPGRAWRARASGAAGRLDVPGPRAEVRWQSVLPQTTHPCFNDNGHNRVAKTRSAVGEFRIDRPIDARLHRRMRSSTWPQ
jgi:hypothetical protein